MQKLLELEEVEMGAEEEPKGEAIVGSNGEALRPLGMGTTFIQKKIFSVWVYLDSSPLSSLLYQSSLVVR